MSEGTSTYVGGDSAGGSSKNDAAEGLEAGTLPDFSYPEVLAELSAYIESLDAASPHLASDVFSPCIAWSNRVFIGIRAFGPTTEGPACVVWKYWMYHQMLLLKIEIANFRKFFTSLTKITEN